MSENKKLTAQVNDLRLELEKNEKDFNQRLKDTIKQKTEKLEAMHQQEVIELTTEWQGERKVIRLRYHFFHMLFSFILLPFCLYVIFQNSQSSQLSNEVNNIFV